MKVVILGFSYRKKIYFVRLSSSIEIRYTEGGCVSCMYICMDNFNVCVRY